MTAATQALLVSATLATQGGILLGCVAYSRKLTREGR